MPIIALTAALGASTCWAVGSLIAHRPATQLGAFEFTRTQLISSFALLIVIVTGVQWLARRYLEALAIVRGGQSDRRRLH